MIKSICKISETWLTVFFKKKFLFFLDAVPTSCLTLLKKKWNKYKVKTISPDVVDEFLPTQGLNITYNETISFVCGDKVEHRDVCFWLYFGEKFRKIVFSNSCDEFFL